MAKMLTQMQAAEIIRMRAEKNDWDEPKYTGLEISVATGASESTVWRVLNRQAAYAKMGKREPGGLTMEMANAALTLAPIASMEAEARASAQRVLARLREVPTQGEEAEAELAKHVPRNPLDGGDVVGEGASGLSALNTKAREMGVDIDQLRGEGA